VSGHAAHCGGERFVQRRLVLLGLVGIALSQRLNVGLFRLARLGGQFFGLAQRAVSLGHSLVAHGQVDVGPVSKGDAPVGHGAVRVEPGRFLKGTNGLVVIECEA
jgi:hypothetical protein